MVGEKKKGLWILDFKNRLSYLILKLIIIYKVIIIIVYKKKTVRYTLMYLRIET